MKNAFFSSKLGWSLAIVMTVVALAGTVSVAKATILTDTVTTTIDIPMYNVAESGIDYSVGSVGSGVQTLEQFLQNRGYFPSTVTPDSAFDMTTMQALASYQAQAHVLSTGYFGPQTRAHMAVLLWFKINGYPTTTQ